MVKISREAIERSYQEGIEAIILLIETLVNQVNILTERIEELENQKAKNSSNSHKPPSGDGFGKRTKSLRKGSERETGGHEGHEGQNLKWVDEADEVIRHEVSECRVCGEDLRAPLRTYLRKYLYLKSKSIIRKKCAKHTIVI